jgi:dihydrofolate synthase/folylpolyglutamate synthase
MDYKESVDYLYTLLKFGMKFGLSSVENLLKSLGQPHLRVPAFHVAGTNGKGSVGATVNSILTQAGYKVGFFSSPHLVFFRERIMVGPEMIDRQDVVQLVEKIRKVMVPEQPPTFFEFITAMAFDHFAEKKVDLAIMEVGMGGRLDSTNVANSLVGAITNISLDHREHLGNTLTEIAGEKAGIIKPGLPLVTGEKRKYVRNVFERVADNLGAKIYCLGRDFKVRTLASGEFSYFGLTRDLKKLELKLLGPHQVRNAAVALASLELLADKGFDFTEMDIRGGLKNVSWPGRAEVFSGPPDVMLDGAHNPGAASVLADLLGQMDYKRLYLVLGIMADKDIPRIMAPLLPRATGVFLTRPDYDRASSLENLSKAAKGFEEKVSMHSEVKQALEAAKSEAGPEDLVLVTGSLFTVGEARAYLTGDEDI